MLDQTCESENKIQCPKCSFKYLNKIRKIVNDTTDFGYYCPHCMTEFDKSINTNDDVYNQKEEIHIEDKKEEDSNKEEYSEVKTKEFKPFVFK